jgi:type I restriction enzyme S subunit
MSEWKDYKLGDVCLKITDGAHNSPPTTTAGYPMASVKDMEYNKINLNSCRTISKEDYQKLVKNDCRPQINDVLIAKDGSYLKHVFDIVKEEDVVLLSSIAIIRPNIEKVISKYLKYIFKNPSFVQLIESNYVTGAVIPRIVLKDFKNIDILLPSLTEQSAIASVLSSLDDKIDMLHRQNKTLEALAETLFRQWFVEEAEEGWKEKTISDIIEVRDGTHDSPKSTEIGYFLITSKHLKSEGIDFKNAYMISEDDYISINKRSKVNKNDILFSMIGTLGLIYYVQEEPDYAIKNIGLFKSYQKPEFAKFLYLLLNSPLGKKFTYESADGSTQEYISLGSLRNFEFKYPGDDAIKNFDNMVTPYFEKIFSNNNQIRTLTRLRDTLLPKLMSGEVRVKLEEEEAGI